MNRIALVTGGGNGLGRAVAERFLADGDTVFITGRNAAQVARHGIGELVLYARVR